jgi:streptomycin 6-kinase
VVGGFGGIISDPQQHICHENARIDAPWRGNHACSTLISRWELTPDGTAIQTHCSRLLPVRHRGRPAMLKIAFEAEEKAGHVLMRWWDGQGAARVLAHDDQALLLERAEGSRSLGAMARSGPG